MSFQAGQPDLGRDRDDAPSSALADSERVQRWRLHLFLSSSELNMEPKWLRIAYTDIAHTAGAP